MTDKQVISSSTKRTITVVTTSGTTKAYELPGNETSWKSLRTLVQRDYSLDNIKCVESISKHTLEHDDAVLPDGNFHLFLMPYRSKSGIGNAKRKAVKARVKSKVTIKKKAAPAKKTVSKPAKKTPSKKVGAGVAKIVASVKSTKVASIEERVTRLEGAVFGAAKSSNENGNTSSNSGKELSSKDVLAEMRNIAGGFKDVKSF